jgi:hypothetical protein
VIISHRHRYLFVELPRTGSTAIHRELRELYDGEPILHKHATYEDFLKRASADEKTYFVFSGIRNPLDDAVSRYFKLRTDHHGRFSTRPSKRKRLVNRIIDRRMFSFLRESDADFATYFMRNHVLPYDRWSSLSHDRFDHVIRFESIVDDFAEALRRIGIEPKRPLPMVNPTATRNRTFSDYYPPHVRARARRVFGPFMERWGYRFPADWGIEEPTTMDRAQYLTFSFFAKLYWRYIRPIV